MLIWSQPKKVISHKLRLAILVSVISISKIATDVHILFGNYSYLVATNPSVSYNLFVPPESSVGIDACSFQ